MRAGLTVHRKATGDRGRKAKKRASVVPVWLLLFWGWGGGGVFSCQRKVHPNSSPPPQKKVQCRRNVSHYHYTCSLLCCWFGAQLAARGYCRAASTPSICERAGSENEWHRVAFPSSEAGRDVSGAALCIDAVVAASQRVFVSHNTLLSIGLGFRQSEGRARQLCSVGCFLRRLCRYSWYTMPLYCTLYTIICTCLVSGTVWRTVAKKVKSIALRECGLRSGALNIAKLSARRFQDILFARRRLRRLCELFALLRPHADFTKTAAPFLACQVPRRGCRTRLCCV